ncbi:MAG: hypothetical protein V1723_04325 [Candidatus Uhrbacteria bacterium]
MAETKNQGAMGALSQIETMPREPTFKDLAYMPSLKLRLPTAYIRMLAALYQKRMPNVTMRAIASGVCQRIYGNRRMNADCCALYRSLTGRVATTTQVMESSLRAFVCERLNLTDDIALKNALRELDLGILPEAGQPTRALAAELEPLVGLWLAYHPEGTHYDLARKIVNRMAADEGRQRSVAALTKVLCGHHKTINRLVLGAVLAELAPNDIQTYQEAVTRWQTLCLERTSPSANRERVPIAHCVELATQWRVANHSPTIRKLVVDLKKCLAKQGVHRSINYLEQTLEGNRGETVERRLLDTLEALIRKKYPKALRIRHDLGEATFTRRTDDLRWINADEVRKIVRDWRAQDTAGRSMRSCAHAIAAELCQLRYPHSEQTIMGPLMGRCRLCRGYVYRAAIKAMTGQLPDSIPEQFFVAHPKALAREASNITPVRPAPAEDNPPVKLADQGQAPTAFSSSAPAVQAAAKDESQVQPADQEPAPTPPPPNIPAIPTTVESPHPTADPPLHPAPPETLGVSPKRNTNFPPKGKMPETAAVKPWCGIHPWRAHQRPLPAKIPPSPSPPATPLTDSLAETIAQIRAKPPKDPQAIELFARRLERTLGITREKARRLITNAKPTHPPHAQPKKRRAPALKSATSDELLPELDEDDYRP